MNLFCACLTEHSYDSVNRSTTNDTVVNHNNPFSFYGIDKGVELDSYAFHTLFLARLNKGSSDVIILDNALFIRDSRFFAVTYGGVNSRFGNADNKVCFNGEFSGKNSSCLLTCFIYADGLNYRIRPCKVNLFKNTGGFFNITLTLNTF